MGKDQIMSLCCRRSVGRQTGLDFSHPGDMLRPYSRDGGGDPSQVSTPQTRENNSKLPDRRPISRPIRLPSAPETPHPRGKRQ